MCRSMFRSWLLFQSILTTVWVAEGTPVPPPKEIPPPVAYLRDQQPPGEAFVQDNFFNEGAYGLYVNQTFKSSNVIAPRINFDKPFSECDDGSYLFITPRGEATKPNPVILDANGSLIWTPGPEFGQVYNFQVETYRDQQYLTFWSGDNSVGGHGAGAYFMFDKHYELYRTVYASNGQGADLHSFTILPNGNALMTVYDKVHADLGGRPNGFPPGEYWIWDSLIQEFNLETGEIVYEWRAADHFSFRESYNRVESFSEFDPWDWFHINMIEKDEAGNYLISARHLRCVAYISGETGDVLWRLGGKISSFRDLSLGEATRFIGQHDAHWDEGHKFITLFDNRADWQFEYEHVSKGTRIELDLQNMTAKVNMTYVHPLNIFAFSQGSYQTLPNGNVLLGYGYTGAMTEFAPNGTVLCDAYLGPVVRFSSGDVQSYRNLKFNWTGIPLTKPSLVREDGRLFMSWHGSTEVRSWILQDAYTPNGPFDSITTIPKTGFETKFILGADMSIRQYVRVLAIDGAEDVLAASTAVDAGEFATQRSPELTSISDDTVSPEVPGHYRENLDEEVAVETGFEDMYLLLGFLALAMFGVLFVFCLTLAPHLTYDWTALVNTECSFVRIPDPLHVMTLWQQIRGIKARVTDIAWKEKIAHHLGGERGSEDSGTALLTGVDVR